MKKSYALFIVVLVILGLWFFMSQNKKVEAPAVSDTNVNNNVQNKIEEQLPPKEEVTLTEEKSNIKEINISGNNFAFAPSGITVKKGDTVRITFKNIEGTHDLRIDGYVATKIIKSGEQETVEFVADKVGSFDYYCSVGSHRAMGMEGALKVE